MLFALSAATFYALKVLEKLRQRRQQRSSRRQLKSEYFQEIANYFWAERLRLLLTLPVPPGPQVLKSPIPDSSSWSPRPKCEVPRSQFRGRSRRQNELASQKPNRLALVSVEDPSTSSSPNPQTTTTHTTTTTTSAHWHPRTAILCSSGDSLSSHLGHQVSQLHPYAPFSLPP